MNVRLHTAAAIVFATSLMAAPCFAADAANATPAKTVTTTATKAPAMHCFHHEGKEEMQKHVEDRITSLHEKLKITAEQESAWADVAKAMRDSENDTIALIHERHMAAKPMTAVEDLESYAKITEVHANGLGKVASAFSDLYDTMSDEQKANADKVFGGFEGHEHGKDHSHAHHHHMHNDAKAK